MNNISFFVEKFVWSHKEDTPDLSFVPANTRRRLNTFDRHVIYSLNSCADENIENIILSSRYGEYKRLFQLIDQHNEYNESSPMMFSASVHNYILGQFTMFKQKTIPTLAVSAGKDSFINGLVTAVTSPQNHLIYCYADDTENDITAMCFKITKSGVKNKYTIRQSENINVFEPAKAVKFFEGEGRSLELNNFCIEREYD